MDCIWRGGVGFNKTEGAGELDSWPPGLALSNRQLRPCRLRLSGSGGCRRSRASPKLAPPKAQYRTTQRRTPLVPYSAHDPPVSLPYASDSARSPEGKSGTRQGRRCIETITCLTSAVHSSAAVRVNALACAHSSAIHFTEWALQSRLGASQLQTYSKRSPESLCDPL